VRRDGGDGIEILRIHEAADSFVMITADKQFSQRARPGNDLVGTGAVAHNIAEIHDEVMRGYDGEASFESFEIRVNIT
jgi:hypothetical protein